jgi:hypothetical protein
LTNLEKAPGFSTGYPQVWITLCTTYPQVIHKLYTGYAQVIHISHMVIHSLGGGPVDNSD